MIIILLGPPGAGKGTIADKIKQKINIPVIATGDILRNVIQDASRLSKEVQTYVNSGKLVPDNLVIKIVENRIQEKDCQNGFVFDGFPRSIEQAQALDLLNSQLGNHIDQVFYFKTSYHTIIERLSGRRVCTKCGSIYNLNYDAPEISEKCDKCGGDLIQRDDDKEKTIKKRLEVYNKETLPLVGYYKERDLLTEINADQDAQDRFCKAWDRLLEMGLLGKKE